MSGRLGRVGAQLGASAVCRPCAPLPMPSSDEIAKQMARCIEVSKAAGERGDGPYLLRTIYMVPTTASASTPPSLRPPRPSRTTPDSWRRGLQGGVT